MTERSLQAIPAALLALALAACGSGGGGSSGGGASGAAASTATTATAQVFFAGAGAVDITPPPGAPLAGFGAAPRREINAFTIPLQVLAALNTSCYRPNPSSITTFFAPATGKLDPIMAKALVLSNGATKMAIIKLDMIGSNRQIRDDLEPVAISLGIPAENFLICSTHTHSGPGALSKQKLWELLAADCYNDGLYQRVRMGIEQALRDADAGLRPATIGIGTMNEANASHNRRGRTGIYDTELGLVKVVDAGGNAIAAWLNFAVHGTALGGSNMLYSADVMGVCEREIEQQLGGVAIFTNGAEGDVAPANGLASGSVLAQDVLGLWPSVAMKPWVYLAGAFTDITLPNPTVNTGCFPIPGGNQTICDIIPGFAIQIPFNRSWISEKGPFQALRVDRTVFAGCPGEPITEVGWDIKARGLAKGFDHTFVLGLANDHLAYFATEAQYIKAEYEGQSTLFGPHTDLMVEQAADGVMDRVKP